MALAGVLALTGAACALGYANDPQFQNWLAQAEARCTPRYGALPIRTPEQRSAVRAAELIRPTTTICPGKSTRIACGFSIL